ncbi:MAG TPA: amidase [Steroidobacteraceae bacterium]|nr:amidase [Steroidobacteraceae bacterium]
MPDLARATLAAAAAAVARGETSSVELTRACLERAHRLNAELNCFIRIEDDAALREAARADEARAAGARLGALHGVPLAAKDMFDDPERETSSGSRIRQGFRATTKATVLARLAAAGAVNLGALNMTEFALGPTGHNAFHGACRNPWNRAHIAGGSSSGAGAAVAARIAFGAVGSDTGGSIRLPAAVNGVLGLKPTYGRVSRAGAMPLSWSTDHVGPLARTAQDLARLLTIIAGHDAADPSSSRRPVPDYEAALAGGVGGLRVGIALNYFFDGIDAEVRRVLEAALRVLEELGAQLTEIEVPAAEHLTELGRAILYSEAAAVHGEWLRTRPEDYSPQVRTRAMTGIAIPAAVYLESLRLRPRILRRFVTSVYADCEVLATPTLAFPVPTLADTDVGAGVAMWAAIARLVHCTAPFNYLGVPALSVPVGFTAGGLPASLQLVGRPFAEATLLRVAAAYQSATDWHQRSPPIS